MPVVSGGARGTDRLAMGAALDAGGVAFGVLADSLERTVRQPDLRQLLLDGQLVLLTPYAPTAGFSVGAAMGRNKVIYGLADFAVVVSSDYQTGGTWAGAVEALKGGWCPYSRATAPMCPKETANCSNSALRRWLKTNCRPPITWPIGCAAMPGLSRSRGTFSPRLPSSLP